MVFSTPIFLIVFLSVVLFGSYVLPKRARNLFLLLANLIFYAYGEPKYVLLMAGSIVLNYVFGLCVGRVERKGAKRAFLAGDIVLNLAALSFFKYTNLIIETLRALPALSNLTVLDIALPIGISFYTFQEISYVIDVYRGDCKATGNIIDFASYVSLFPQLIAGPIVRYVDVEKSLKERKITLGDVSYGVRLFIIGLSKKVLLANQFGIMWNSVNDNLTHCGTLGAWMGAAAYTMQIYFDFSGYSDMARGLGKMLGFDFCVNFNYPYISKSVTEFWRRWHISLSGWFRDYVYIPMGGNRVKKSRFCFNILTVWALTGLWHGAGWNFLFWGFYYGVILLFEKLVLGDRLEKLPGALRHVYTMLVVMIGWVFFASESFGGALSYLKAMFTFSVGGFMLLLPWAATITVGIIASTPLLKKFWDKAGEKKVFAFSEAALCLIALILCTASLVSDTYNPFLYFRF